MAGWRDSDKPTWGNRLLRETNDRRGSQLPRLRREALAGPLGYYERQEVLDAIHADPDDACDGNCISRPHLWSPSGARCTRSGCGVVGTGDPCGDGDCEGEE